MNKNKWKKKFILKKKKRKKNIPREKDGKSIGFALLRYNTNHALSTCRFILCETNSCEFEPLLIRFSATNKFISVTAELWAVGKEINK